MNRLRRAALVSALAQDLGEKGSWSGETHVQKATFVLQELLDVPLDYEYVLYKHGPYSFELHDELSEMRADRILVAVARPRPYGPSLIPGEGVQQLRKRFPKTLSRYARQRAFVADALASKDVSDLERLATALWVTKHEGGSVTERAAFLRRLKPHVSESGAGSAVEEVDELRTQAEALANH
jgi:uncharacterized protein YwgA